jgi:hypothetical protein
MQLVEDFSVSPSARLFGGRTCRGDTKEEPTNAPRGVSERCGMSGRSYACANGWFRAIANTGAAGSKQSRGPGEAPRDKPVEAAADKGVGHGARR